MCPLVTFSYLNPNLNKIQFTIHTSGVQEHIWPVVTVLGSTDTQPLHHHQKFFENVF